MTGGFAGNDPRFAATGQFPLWFFDVCRRMMAEMQFWSKRFSEFR